MKPNRYIVEHADGEISYIVPRPNVVSLRHPVRLTFFERAHCAALRWKARVAWREIAKMNDLGIYGTRALLRYEAQADEFHAQIARIEASAAQRGERKPPSILRQLLVAVAIVMLLALGAIAQG